MGFWSKVTKAFKRGAEESEPVVGTPIPDTRIGGLTSLIYLSNTPGSSPS